MRSHIEADERASLIKRHLHYSSDLLPRSSSSNYSLAASDPTNRDLKSNSFQWHSGYSSTSVGQPGNIAALSQRDSRRIPRSRRQNASLSIPVWKLPSMNFPPLALSNYSDSSDDFYESPDEARSDEYPHVFAPVAERPISTQDNRKRFSRILDTNCESPTATTQRNISTRPHTPDDLKVQSSIENHGVDTTPHKHILAQPLRELSVSYTGTTPVGQHGHWNGIIRQNRVTQLSPYTENSTVDSLLEKHIECLGLGVGLSDDDSEIEASHDVDAAPVSLLEDTSRPSSPTSVRDLSPVTVSANRQPLDAVLLVPDEDEIVPSTSRRPASQQSDPRYPLHDSTAHDKDRRFPPAAGSSISPWKNSLPPRETTPEAASNHSPAFHATTSEQKTKFKVRLPPNNTRASSISLAERWASASVLDPHHATPCVNMEASVTNPIVRHLEDDDPRFRLKMKRSFMRNSLSDADPAPSGSQSTIPPEPLEEACTKSSYTVRPSPDPIRSFRSRTSSVERGGPIGPISSSALSTSLVGRAPGEIDMLPAFTPRRNVEVTIPVAPIPPLVLDSRSRFSDNTSQMPAVGSIRKRLQSLRQRLPGPRASSTNAGVLSERRRAISHSRSRTASRQERRSEDVTWGLSNFDYNGKKMVGRLRDWWRRCLPQRGFHLSKRKGERNGREAAGIVDAHISVLQSHPKANIKVIA